MSEQDVTAHLAPATVDVRLVMIVAASVLLFLIASMGIMALIFFSIAPSDRAPTPAALPQPELQAHPAGDLRDHLARQRAELSGYRWANSDHSLVAIPIERAMEMIAQRGANAYGPIETSKATTALPQPGGRP